MQELDKSKKTVVVTRKQVMLIPLLIGVSAIGVFASSRSSLTVSLASLSGGLAVAGAAFLIGNLLGLLFAIPRVVQSGVSTEENDKASYRPNTNLEEISDWLTKILVGVGLTQIQELRSSLVAVGSRLSALFGGGEVGTAFALSVIFYFLPYGFLVGFLATRILLPKPLRDADSILAGRLQRAESAAQRAEVANLRARSAAMFAALYQPEGFRRTINLAEEYRRDFGDPLDPRFWSNLAAAYGQLFSWQEKHETSEKERSTTRSRALEAVDKALASDRETAFRWLKMIWDPNYPKKDKQENDLEVFWKDKEFQKRLGGEGD